MTTDSGISNIFSGQRNEDGMGLSHASRSFYVRFGKRIFDVSVVVLCAPVAAPCVAGMLVGARMFTATPFVLDTRIGRNGDRFRVLRSAANQPGDWHGALKLPLLWNVLKGDLSLVGPRPMTPGEAESHSGISYYHLRPGLIDPCLKHERIALPRSVRVAKNAEYLINQSLFGDLLAIWKRCRG